MHQDIEKKLVSVDEGHTNFLQTFKKLQAAVNQTQKERFEAELKKEIKKLQRLRESLRSYESQDSRYKSKITEARRKIEELMELHKQTEKESKTKAFSKEGLLITPKPDPHEEEKEEMRDMIKTLQGNFKDKMNAKETELERIRLLKNKNTSMQDEIIKQLKGLYYHFEKLEMILRSIENDNTTLEQIWSIHDALESYLRADDSTEFDLEIEQRYKELNLPLKTLQHFPSLSEDDQEQQKKVSTKKNEVKSTALTKTDPKPIEKGWNTKEALIKITGKVERIPEDLTDDEIELVSFI